MNDIFTTLTDILDVDLADNAAADSVIQMVGLNLKKNADTKVQLFNFEEESSELNSLAKAMPKKVQPLIFLLKRQVNNGRSIMAVKQKNKVFLTYSKAHKCYRKV